jgi:hypothetical protein
VGDRRHLRQYFVAGAVITGPRRRFDFVMPALVAGIHVLETAQQVKTWMAGTSPAMTAERLCGLNFDCIEINAIIR